MTVSTQDIYLLLLRQAIYSVDDSQCTMHGEDIEVLVYLAQIQGTAPLIYNQLLMHNAQCTMHNDLVMQMKQVCMQNMVAQEGLLRILKKTFAALSAGGIHPVLLKGFGLATLYPKPYLRSWGDLDVYVGPEQYHQAAALLRDAFPHAKHHDEEWEELKHYNFVMPDGLVEMHRTTVKMEHPRDKRVYYALENAAMQSNASVVQVEDLTVHVPEDKFNMLFVFLHAVHHFVEEGLGFKQICDVCLLAHHIYAARATDEKRLAEYKKYMKTNLCKLRLSEMWQLFGYICVEKLGLPAQEWPLLWCTIDDAQCTMEWNRWLQKHGELFAQRVMTEGLARPEDYGDSKDRYEAREKALKMNVVARKWLTFQSHLLTYRMVKPYSPMYARHLLMSALWKGARRLVKKEPVVLY